MLNHEIGDPFLGGFRPITKQNINELLQRHDYPSVSERLRISLLRTPKKLEEPELLQVAADELEALKVDDLRKWYTNHKEGLGHKRLRRLLVDGEPVERLLGKARKTLSETPKKLLKVETDLQVAADELGSLKVDDVSKLSKWWNKHYDVITSNKKLGRLL